MLSPPTLITHTNHAYYVHSFSSVHRSNNTRSASHSVEMLLPTPHRCLARFIYADFTMRTDAIAVEMKMTTQLQADDPPL